MGSKVGNLGALQYQERILNKVRIKGRDYLLNGYEPMQRYDYNTNVLAEAGLLAPIITPIAAAGAAGGLTGDYEYYVTEYDVYHDIESPVSPAITVTVAVQQVNFTNFPGIRNARTTHFNIYRGIAGATGRAKGRIAQVDALAPPAVEVDNTGDDALQALLTSLPLSAIDDDPPPVMAYPVLCRGQLFLWGRFGYKQGKVDVSNGGVLVHPDADCKWNRGIIGHQIVINEGTDHYTVTDYLNDSPLALVIDPAFRDADVQGGTYHTFVDDGDLYWSRKDNPDSVPAGNHRHIARGQGLRGTGIAELHGFPVLFTANQTWMLQYGDDPGDTNLARENQLSDTIGNVAHRTTAKINANGERLVWLSRFGIATTTGGAVQLVSDAPHYPAGMRAFFDDMNLDAKGEAQVACAVNYQRGHLYICALPTEDSRGGCDKIVVWDYKLNNFWVWKLPYEIYSMESAKKFEKDPDDENKVYEREIVLLGTEHGYVTYWPAGENDGASRDDTEGTLSGTVSSANATSLTDLSAAFMMADISSPPELLGLEGAYVTVENQDDGTLQHRRITSNLEQILTVEDWDTTPVAGDSYWIGEIENYYKTPKIDFNTVAQIKDIKHLHVVFEPEDAGELRLACWEDQNPDAMIFDDGDVIDLTGAEDKTLKRTLGAKGKGRAKMLVNADCYHFQFELGNRKPNQPWTAGPIAMPFDARFE